MKVYIYPADSIIGGTIETREVVHWTDRKALFGQRDRYGYLGAKLSTVFLTEDQAINARWLDHIISSSLDE